MPPTTRPDDAPPPQPRQLAADTVTFGGYVDVLDALDEPRSATEIYAEVPIGMATVYRRLDDLEATGFAARELLLYDDWTDQLVETGNGAPQPQRKLDEWNTAWEQALAKHSEVRRL